MNFVKKTRLQGVTTSVVFVFTCATLILVCHSVDTTVTFTQCDFIRCSRG